MKFTLVMCYTYGVNMEVRPITKEFKIIEETEQQSLSLPETKTKKKTPKQLVMLSYDVTPEINEKRYTQVEYETDNRTLSYMVRNVGKIKGYKVGSARAFYNVKNSSQKNEVIVKDYRTYFNKNGISKNMFSCLFSGEISGEKLWLIFNFRTHTIQICGIDFKTVEQVKRTLTK